MKTRVLVIVFVVVLAAVIAGCGSHSPYVGSWTNHFGLGSSTITLNGDGTGSASGFVYGAGKTFSWHETGENLISADNWKDGSGNNCRTGFDSCQLSPDGKNLTTRGDSYQKDTE